MAAYFLDTSTVVKRYVQETGTAWVQALADPASGHFLYVARITDVEMTAAIARRRRLAISALFRPRWPCMPSARTLPSNTASWNSRSPSCNGHQNSPTGMCWGLRHSAAATALDLSITLLSADTELNTAALVEGLLVDDPNSHP